MGREWGGGAREVLGHGERVKGWGGGAREVPGHGERVRGWGGGAREVLGHGERVRGWEEGEGMGWRGEGGSGCCRIPWDLGRG